eukprot:Rmarinus@m.4570
MVSSCRFKLLFCLVVSIITLVVGSAYPDQITSFEMTVSMKAVLVQGAGGPEGIYIGDRPRPEATGRQVLIKVHASALNRLDLLQRRGLLPVPEGVTDIMGVEVAGEVEAIGPECQGNWTRGEHVMALLSGGGHAEYALSDERHVMRVPNNMTLDTAAAIPEAWLTAYQLVSFLANGKAGDTALVHASGSGVGTALTQLCKMRGMTVIATARNAEKLAVSKELGAAHTINTSETPNFSFTVDKITNGKGVDIVFDCVGGGAFDENLKSIATDGRWVLYGLLGGPEISGPALGQILRKRVQLTATLLRSRSDEYKGELVAAFTNEVLPLFKEGKLKTVIDSDINFKDIQHAHEKMEANKNTGKIVLTW